MSLKTSDFDYDLPEELIAQTPLERRDASRLLVYDRADDTVAHRVFTDIIEYLHPGDVLVVNDTRVIPARIVGVRPDTGGKMEFLLLKRVDAGCWEALAKPARRARVGSVFVFGDGRLKAEVVSEGDEGMRTVRLICDGVLEEALDAVGAMPLPPYIHERLKDPERYQTVYSRERGSAAAPTAGLHFTPELLQRLAEHGIPTVPILLHVGLGTFRPVAVEDVSEHKMHSEYYEITPEAAARINAARAGGHRIVAVGTTSARTLETAADPDGILRPGSGWTNIFITPGYQFRAVDAMITNFHLPRSTLLMMISAFAGSRERMLHVYETAVMQRYRFFSFGDAMLLL